MLPTIKDNIMHILALILDWKLQRYCDIAVEPEFPKSVVYDLVLMKSVVQTSC